MTSTSKLHLVLIGPSYGIQNFVEKYYKGPIQIHHDNINAMDTRNQIVIFSFQMENPLTSDKTCLHKQFVESSVMLQDFIMYAARIMVLCPIIIGEPDTEVLTRQAKYVVIYKNLFLHQVEKISEIIELKLRNGIFHHLPYSVRANIESFIKEILDAHVNHFTNDLQF